MQSWKTSIKALTVDVFGTVTDWYSTIIREGERIGSQKQISVDWAQLRQKMARRLRARYGARTGRRIALDEDGCAPPDDS